MFVCQFRNIFIPTKEEFTFSSVEGKIKPPHFQMEKLGNRKFLELFRRAPRRREGRAKVRILPIKSLMGFSSGCG
jgi:hypothetical protein